MFVFLFVFLFLSLSVFWIDLFNELLLIVTVPFGVFRLFLTGKYDINAIALGIVFVFTPVFVVFLLLFRPLLLRSSSEHPKMCTHRIYVFFLFYLSWFIRYVFYIFSLLPASPLLVDFPFSLHTIALVDTTKKSQLITRSLCFVLFPACVCMRLFSLSLFYLLSYFLVTCLKVLNFYTLFCYYVECIK